MTYVPTWAGFIYLAMVLDVRLVDILWRNEMALRPRAVVETYLNRVIERMLDCIDRGVAAGGVLPGGLNVQRRAAALAKKVSAGQLLSAFDDVGLAWLNVYAIAVNEENAAGGRVVTAPTNGAAVVVPAVLRYYRSFRRGSREQAQEFLLVAAESVRCAR